MAITRGQSLSPGRGFYSGMCWLRVCISGVEHRRSTARPAPILSDVLCRSHVLRVRITTQTQKVQHREGRTASQACCLLPTNLPEQYQVSCQCASIANLETQLTCQNIVLMCPPHNFKSQHHLAHTNPQCLHSDTVLLQADTSKH